MSYRIFFGDGNTIDVEDDRGAKLKEAKLNNPSSQVVEIGDDLYELGRIKSVKKVHDSPLPPQMRAPDPNRCRGQRSIQFYIMKVIRAQHPGEWAKYFRDKAYKEKLRLKIRAEKEGPWCDSAAGECACASDWKADDKRVAEIQSMFPGAKATGNVPGWDELFR